MHPTSDSLFMYGTNKGTLKMCDLRVSVLSDNNAINFKNEITKELQNYFKILKIIFLKMIKANYNYSKYEKGKKVGNSFSIKIEISGLKASKNS